MYDGPERRDQERESNRSRRIKVGGVSSGIGAPMAILVVYLLEQNMDMTLPEYVVIAIAAVVGSTSTWIAMCAHDMRAIVLRLFMRRRSHDSRRRR